MVLVAVLCLGTGVGPGQVRKEAWTKRWWVRIYCSMSRSVLFPLVGLFICTLITLSYNKQARYLLQCLTVVTEITTPTAAVVCTAHASIDLCLTSQQAVEVILMAREATTSAAVAVTTSQAAMCVAWTA